MIIDILNLSREALVAALAEMGEKPFRAKQVWQWLYFRGASDFSAMSDLSKGLREALASRFFIGRPKAVASQESVDGTRKRLLEFSDGARVESVFIPEKDRGSLCLSTQAGCALGCAFCHTGTQGFARNLTVAEIVGQVAAARGALGDWGKTDGRRLTNIVVMGMGEPLLNFEPVATALRIMLDQDGLAFSRRKVTLSTAGIAPKIVPMIRETGVKLAVSLHAPNDDLRRRIMPIADKYPMAELMAACREYCALEGSRFITFEYLMLAGFNDSPALAKELASLMKKHKLGAKFNLIAFNPWPGCGFSASPKAAIKEFASILESAGYEAPIRVARGADILAACGQLKGGELNIAN